MIEIKHSRVGKMMVIDVTVEAIPDGLPPSDIYNFLGLTDGE